MVIPSDSNENVSSSKEVTMTKKELFEQLNKLLKDYPDNGKVAFMSEREGILNDEILSICDSNFVKLDSTGDPTGDRLAKILIRRK